MDLVTQTSLEALLLKATNCQNHNVDIAAVEAFSTLINKEKDGAHIGVKVIADRIHSGVEKEVLQTLNILDSCMNRCGTHFQSEVGKFRFLNEMIKLVSPKYLGCQTPLSVKQKVLQLMYVWTVDYPKEIKIKEAYEMLRKQGVIREIPNPNVSIEPNSLPKQRINSIFQDEEKSKILQKLLQSKDPEDIQAANWLIKSMVKEDDKRAELKSRRISELESVQNNVRLLNEMLDSYKPGISSSDELDLIKELHQSCGRLRPSLIRLASETPQNEELLADVLQISDELSQTFNKFHTVVIEGKALFQERRAESYSALLSFDVSTDKNYSNADCGQNNDLVSESKSDMDVLCDIFNASNIPDSAEVLKPITVNSEISPKTDDKLRGLEELDILGEHLLKENLQASQSYFNKPQEKLSMNLLSKQSYSMKAKSAVKKATSDSVGVDLTCFLNSLKQEQTKSKKVEEVRIETDQVDDFLVDISSDEKLLETEQVPEGNPTTVIRNGASIEEKLSVPHKGRTEVKLGDLSVKLENIKPSGMAPLTILNGRGQLSITLHFAKDRPRKDVHVFVVTTVSKNEVPLKNYLFQAVVPKDCKLKLQTPSATHLPAYNPFLPPSAITQVMLIAKPEDVQISFKFIVSYSMEDETITEMGEVENLNVL